MQARHERCDGAGKSEGCIHLPGVARKTCGHPLREVAFCYQVPSGSCGIVKVANEGLLEDVHGQFEEVRSPLPDDSLREVREARRTLKVERTR